MEMLLTAAPGKFGFIHPVETQDKVRRFVFGARPEKTLRRVLVWGIAVIILFHECLLPIKIIGSSMQPTYRDGSLNFINRISYTYNMPHRGDVVAVHYDGELLLKRIVAVPGEKVAIRGGHLFINGRILNDTFVDSSIPSQFPATLLGSDEYFVIGDNRGNTVYAPVPRESILGKIMF